MSYTSCRDRIAELLNRQTPLPGGCCLVIPYFDATGESVHYCRLKPKVAGRPRQAPTCSTFKAAGRIVAESRVYFAKYRDCAGVLRVISTGCRDKQAAQAKLADLMQTAERVWAGVLTAAEVAVASKRDKPLADHINDYLAHMEAAGCSDAHRRNVRRQLTRIATECQVFRLDDLNRQTFEKWLVKKVAGGMSARTRNCQLIAATGYCNWCAHDAVRRLVGKPLAGIPMLNEKADPRRKRRALSEDELHKGWRWLRRAP